MQAHKPAVLLLGNVLAAFSLSTVVLFLAVPLHARAAVGTSAVANQTSSTSGSIPSAVPTATITQIQPSSGAVGTSVTISGTNLTGATAVTFGGKAASFKVASATQITSTVPTGATSGKIRVTTPGGSATSASNFTVTASFRHPGVLVNRLQLDFIRDKVNAGVEPWKSAFDKANSDSHGSLSYKAKPWATVECGSSSNPNYGCSDERNDAEAAYTHALLWYISGDTAHAEKSIQIMNAWAKKLTGGHINSNAPLQAGWTGSVWPEAAEIIRYTYNGWAAADIAKFQTMLTKQYMPNLINGAPCKNGNWELIIIEALMNIAVFNDDRSTFNKAISMWRARVPAYMYLSSDGATPVPPPKCSSNVKTYWDQTVFVDGLAQETARDFGHMFWGLAAAVNTAETALQQGTDLYSENGQRIMAAFEFHNKINNGGSAPSGVNVGPTGGNGPTMEIMYNHFHTRSSFDLPQTAAQIAKKRPTGLNYFLCWETLTHAQVGWTGVP